MRSFYCMAVRGRLVNYHLHLGSAHGLSQRACIRSNWTGGTSRRGRFRKPKMYGRNRKLVSRNSSGCHFGDHTPWRRHFIGSQKPCFVDSTFRGPPLEGRPPIGDPSDSESIAPANVSTEAQEKEEAFLWWSNPSRIWTKERSIGCS